MKTLLACGVFILSIFLLSCSDTKKDEADLKKLNDNSISKEESKSLTQKNEGVQKGSSSSLSSRLAEATIEGKIEKGEIILLSKDIKPNTFKFTGSKISAMRLPDGNLYQVEMDGDRTMINIPDKGEFQLLKLNGKYYLFDEDNQAYEVKFIKKDLVAEATDLTDVLLAMK